MARPRILIPLLVGFILLAAGCYVFAQESMTLAKAGGDPHVTIPLPLNAPLNPIFEAAAKTYHVPVEMLLTLGYFGSAFENRGDAPTIEGGYGIMALRDNILGGDSLSVGSSLTGVSADKLKTDPKANIYAAAAVLDSYAKDMKIKRNQGLDQWLDPLVKYAGLGQTYSRLFAEEVLEKLQSGLNTVNSTGERFAFSPQDIGAVSLEDLKVPHGGKGGKGAPGQIGIFTAQYGPAIWYPAASCNYQTYSESKDTIIVHTIEGTAAGCLSWFQNCSAQVSSHYVVSEAGGVWQCVDEWYRAWHVGCLNPRSIGIEHEGYASSPSHPQPLYNASGFLSRDICNSWGIAKAHYGCPPGILGHIDANNCVCGPGHTDPGSGWDWNYYIAVVAGRRLDVFARGTDNGLWHRTYADGWSAWESLGGGLAGAPDACSWAPGRLDVFMRGTDNALWHKWYENGWSNWESLGGTLTSDPSAASWGPGRIDVFARGTDNGLIHKFYQNGWSAWESLGGGLAGAPDACSWGSGHLDVYIRGTDNQLWHKWYGSGWSAWDPQGGTLTSDPSAVSWGSGRIDVFARGTDNGLIHKFYQSGWSAWESLGGGLAGAPDACSWGSGHLDVYMRGTDNQLWHKWYGSGWSNWESLGGTLTSDPGAVSWK